MSRRKQSNPKPLNKGDCSDTTEEMTVDSRDSKDSNNTELLAHTNHLEEAHENSSNNTEKYLETEMAETSADEAMAKNYIKMPTSNVTQEDSQQSPISLHSNGTITSDNNKDAIERLDIDDDDDDDNDGDGNDHGSAGKRTPKHREESNSPRRTTFDDLAKKMPIPKLRLNALLASDPALKPDARDLKTLHEETQTKNRANELAKMTKNEPMEQLTEPLHKTAAAAAPVDVAAPRLKVFMCLPCGIGFSSFSTLEAHQAYYCSHRNKEGDEESATAAASNIADKSGSLSVSPTASVNSNSANASTNAAEPNPKALKTGKQYACTQCSYSADKKVSLNRHMRMHQTSPAPSSTTSNGGYDDTTASQQNDRYCSDCDIRFNTVKTYRAHKQHYCSSRRSEGQLTPKLEVNTVVANKTPNLSAAVSPQTRTKTPTPALVAAAALLQQPPQPFFALPTHPILIIPYSLIRAASLIPGPLPSISPGVANPEATCFTLDNNALKPLATALNITGLNANPSTPSTPLPRAETTPTPTPTSAETLLAEKSNSRQVEVNESAALKRKEASSRESAPLDLSLRRSPITAILQRQRMRTANAFLDAEQQRLEMESLLESAKENLSLDDSGSITPEQIVCAPSLPNSPSMSPSPKRRAISPRSSGAGSTSSMSPPAALPPTAAYASASSLLENLPLRSLLPADIALKLSESNIINPLLAKQNLELALKLSAAAAAAVNSTNAGSTPAEMANKSSLLGLAPVLTNATVPAATATTASPVQPQIYVKQGVSKCKECNIVFCKYENYLAHKQHYCSARNQEPADGETKLSNTPPNNAAATAPEATPMAYQQLICAACGIKYTSLDNLRAHQNYYCPKGGGAVAAAAAAATASNTATTAEVAPMPLPKEKCSKCKCKHDIGLPCPPPATIQQTPPSHLMSSASGSATPSGHQNFYKCPVCDAVSLTSSESRKHMETHGTVKAFRCTICRYKGNTLRGMRTHIRMHFDKKTADVNEEHYMACILEDEGIEIPSAATLNQEQLAQQIAVVQQQQQQKQLQQAAAAAAAVAAGLQHQHQHQHQHQQPHHHQHQQQQQLYNCDICNYSSTYKGNVLRHMKLVHPQIPINSPSTSPDAEVNDTYDATSMGSSLNGDADRHNYTAIKTEPMDHSVAIANAALHDNNNSPPINAASRTSPAEYSMTHIKSEPMDITIETTTATTTTIATPTPTSTVNSLAEAKRNSPILVAPPLNLPLQLPLPLALPPVPLNTTTSTENATAMVNQKYCETCDIPFNYMKTYLAHKQFYCKNKLRRPETNDSPSPHATMQSPNALLLQKNKENLQQEAAI